MSYKTNNFIKKTGCIYSMKNNNGQLSMRLQVAIYFEQRYNILSMSLATIPNIFTFDEKNQQWKHIYCESRALRSFVQFYFLLIFKGKKLIKMAKMAEYRILFYFTCWTWIVNSVQRSKVPTTCNIFTNENWKIIGKAVYRIWDESAYEKIGKSNDV